GACTEYSAARALSAALAVGHNPLEPDRLEVLGARPARRRARPRSLPHRGRATGHANPRRLRRGDHQDRAAGGRRRPPGVGAGAGGSGRDRERAGYGWILQGVSGLMSITGERDGHPVKAGVAIVDEITAPYAHGAILAALRHRDRSGRGQKIECSLLECSVATLMNAAISYLLAGVVQGRGGSAHETVVPYQAVRDRDGYLIIGVGNERLWKTFCEAIGAPEWADDPRFASNARRVERREELVRLIEERLAARSRDEWIREFAAAGLPAGPINTIDQTFKDPQVLHRGMVQEVDHPTAGRVRLVGIP